MEDCLSTAVAEEGSGLEPKGIPPKVAEEAALGSSSITGWEFSIRLPTRRQS